jgi:nitroreductase
MELEQALTTRYSARKFLPRQVERKLIEQILALAQRTASWCNVQPWQVIVTSGDATNKFRDAMLAHVDSGAPQQPDFAFPERYEGDYRGRRVRCGVQLYQSLGIAREDRAAAKTQALENFRLFDASHVALITTEAALGFWGGLDCGLYINSFMLAARSLGVDTIAQAALASYPGFVREYFGLPENRKLICGISFGYADAEHSINQYRTERAAVAEAVRFVD